MIFGVVLFNSLVRELPRRRPWLVIATPHEQGKDPRSLPCTVVCCHKSSSLETQFISGQNTQPFDTEMASPFAKISGAEIAKHNSATSCWIVVDSNVYDITSFLHEHPGGAAILLQQAGSVG